MKRYRLSIMLFVLAFILFYIGLGVGLIHSPNMGTLLWLLAAGIAIFGVVRLKMVRSQQEQ